MSCGLKWGCWGNEVKTSSCLETKWEGFTCYTWQAWFCLVSSERPWSELEVHTVWASLLVLVSFLRGLSAAVHRENEVNIEAGTQEWNTSEVSPLIVYDAELHCLRLRFRDLDSALTLLIPLGWLPQGNWVSISLYCLLLPSSLQLFHL